MSPTLEGSDYSEERDSKDQRVAKALKRVGDEVGTWPILPYSLSSSGFF